MVLNYNLVVFFDLDKADSGRRPQQFGLELLDALGILQIKTANARAAKCGKVCA